MKRKEKKLEIKNTFQNFDITNKQTDITSVNLLSYDGKIAKSS